MLRAKMLGKVTTNPKEESGGGGANRVWVVWGKPVFKRWAVAIAPTPNMNLVLRCLPRIT